MLNAQRKDYPAAAALAFEMGQPRRLLSVVDAVLAAGGGPAAGTVLETLAGVWDKCAHASDAVPESHREACAVIAREAL